MSEGRSDLSTLAELIGAGTKANSALMQQNQTNKEMQLKREMPGIEEQAQEKLKGFVGGQQKEKMQQVQDFMDQNAKLGRKVSASSGEGTFSASQNEPNYLLQMSGKTGQEATAIQKTVDARLKPHREGAAAAQATLDQLDLGTDASIKTALMNEAKLYGGARGVATLMNVLAPGGNLPGFEARISNYLNGKGQSPLTPDMLNNLRESVYTRSNSLNKDYQQQKQQLDGYVNAAGSNLRMTGGLEPFKASLYSNTDQTFNTLTQSHKAFMDQKVNAIKQGQGTYQNQQPAYSPQEGMMDRASRIFGFGQKQPRQAAAPQGAAPGKMRVKEKASGQTGTIDSAEFDPSLHEQVQ